MPSLPDSTDQSSSEGVSMFCADGVELLREYRICIAQRVEARDRLMSASANVKSEWEENLYGANHADSA